MFNTNGMSSIMQKQIDRMFKRVDGVVWDLMTGRVGVKKGESVLLRGELVFTDDTNTEADFDITEQIFEQFSMPIPAFAQNTSRTDVKIGDMIVLGNGSYGWVKKINPKSYTIMTTNGTTTTWTPPKIEALGFSSNDGIMVVRSLMQMGGSTDGNGNLQSMQTNLMPMLMMMGDNDEAMNSMIPMMLMMQSQGAGSSFANMMPMMMMMNMTGGKNPFK